MSIKRISVCWCATDETKDLGDQHSEQIFAKVKAVNEVLLK